VLDYGPEQTKAPDSSFIMLFIIRKIIPRVAPTARAVRESLEGILGMFRVENHLYIHLDLNEHFIGILTTYLKKLLYIYIY